MMTETQQILECKKQHYWRNRARILAYKKQHYTEHRERILERKRRHYWANREEKLERARGYRTQRRINLAIIQFQFDTDELLRYVKAPKTKPRQT